MASFRGQRLSPNSLPNPEVRLGALINELAAAARPDRQRWEAFLNEAGGVELSELGEVLAGRPVADRTRVLKLLEAFAKSPDWNIRESATQVLGAMGGERAQNILWRLLSDRKEEHLVRLAALRGLRELGAILPVEVVQYVLKDPSPLLRGEAARILASTQRRDRVEPLLDDPDEAVRSDAAEALGLEPHGEEFEHTPHDRIAQGSGAQ